MQKILINGLQLGNTNTGVQNYTIHLYNEFIKSHYDQFSIHLQRPSDFNTGLIKYNRYRRIFFENFLLPQYIKKHEYNLYHSPNYVLPYYINFPSVLTIHDVITHVFPKLCQTESVLYFRLLLSRSIKNATKIIAVSNTVKNDILSHFNVAEEKISVIYHGVTPIFKKTINKAVLEKYHLPESYILFVGNIEPKKNLERLIRAFNLLKKTSELKHKLVITGKKGWKNNTVFKTIDELKINNEIIFTGYIPDEDLPNIYSMADLFVFPSLYEGFGIPPLEAMSCEIPVIVSNKGALPEITGGNCLQVDPFNIQDITKGMHKLLTDTNLRQKTIQQGKDWAKQFTWEKTAQKTINLYKQAIKFKDDVSENN